MKNLRKEKFTARVLRRIGITVSKKNILFVQLGIVCLCALVTLLVIASSSQTSSTAGNFDEMVQRYPELTQ